MSDLQILTIVGSLREDSWNHRLAVAAAKLAPAGMALDIARSDLPIYDADVDAATPPPDVDALRRRAADAAGIVVVTPEYNYGIPGPLKNTLDWLSRPAFSSPLRDKAVTSFGASPGSGGTGRAVTALNQFFFAVAAAPLPWPAVAIGSIGEVLDADGTLDERYTRRLTGQLEAFMLWIEAVDAYRAARS